MHYVDSAKLMVFLLHKLWLFQSTPVSTANPTVLESSTMTAQPPCYPDWFGANEGCLCDEVPDEIKDFFACSV